MNFFNHKVLDNLVYFGVKKSLMCFTVFVLTMVSFTNVAKATPSSPVHDIEMATDSDKFLSQSEYLNLTQSWLKYIDNKAFQASWFAGSELFKEKVEVEKWINALTLHREPLGGVLARRLIAFNKKTSLPGVPDGHFVVLQFQSQFEFKNVGHETISLALDEDNTWRVAGYLVR